MGKSRFFKFLQVAMAAFPLTGVISETVTEDPGGKLDWDFSNAASISRFQIESLPYHSLEEILSLQNGVIVMRDRDEFYSSSETELHVRGGRDYENGFYLNGVNVVDPISGVYTANFSTKALDRIDFYSGSFPAEFGNANSSIINMSTVAGGDRISGFAEIQSDNKIGSDFGKNNYLLSLEGPITRSKNLRFFGLVERTDFDDRYPSPITENALLGNPNRLPGNWLEGWTYHGKMSLSLSQSANFTAFIDGSNQEWSEYLHEYYFDSVHTPYHDDDNLSIGGSFSHEIVPGKTSYSIDASFFRSERFQGDGVYRDDLWGYGRPGGNYGTDPFNLFYHSDIDSTPVVTDTVRVYMSPTDTVGQVRAFVVGGDEGHVYDEYQRHKAEVFTVSGSIKNSFREWHKSTLGFEYKRYTIRYYQHLFPVNVWQGVPGNGFVDAINYGYNDFGEETDEENWGNETKHPTTLSGFLEKSYKIGILEISPSMRFDRWDLDALQLRNPRLPLDPDTANDAFSQSLELSDMEKVDPIGKLSPRISVGAEFSEATSAFASAGIYYQMPPYVYLYNDYEFVEYKITTGGYFVPHGNSGLKPEKSTLLEAGISHRLNSNIQFQIGGYLKWGRDQVQMYFQPSLPSSYGTYRNFDETNVKGLELRVSAKAGKNSLYDLKYSFCDVEGNGSYPSSQYYAVWTITSTPDGKQLLDYAQKHTLAGIFQWDFRGGEKHSQRFQFLNNFLFSTAVKYESQLPYTPIQEINEASLFPFAPIAIDETNSRRMKDRLTIDIRMERSIFIGSLGISPFVTITNLLDKKNVSNVWSYSGLPNSTGWLQTSDGQQWIQANNSPDYTGLDGEEKYYIKEQLPSHYYAPRQFFFGLKGTF